MTEEVYEVPASLVNRLRDFLVSITEGEMSFSSTKDEAEELLEELEEEEEDD